MACQASIPTIPLIDCCGGGTHYCYNEIRACGIGVARSAGLGITPTLQELQTIVGQCVSWVNSQNPEQPSSAYSGTFANPSHQVFAHWNQADRYVMYDPAVYVPGCSYQYKLNYIYDDANWYLGWSGIRIARLSSGEIWTMACRMRYFTELSPPDYCVATVDKLGLTVQTESCEDQSGGILDIPCPTNWLPTFVPTVIKSYPCVWPIFADQFASDVQIHEIVAYPKWLCPLVGKAGCCVTGGGAP